MRRRMIRETEFALLVGLSSKRTPRIPAIEVGRGSFTRTYAAAFWEQVLDISPRDRERFEAAFAARIEETPVIELA
jgi:hypothetical protein